MNEQIQFLISLQEKDTAIAELNEIIKDLPVKVEEWRQAYKNKEDKLTQMQKYNEEVAKNLRSNERKLLTVEDELKKFRARIYEVKSQKEMISLDNEIKKGEEEKSKLEENILKLMDEHDDLNNRIKSFSNNLKEEAVELKKEEEETNQKIELNTNKLKLVTEQRKEISKKVVKEILSLYEKIRANKNNLAVVPIKNNICQGCFITIPPQVINEIKESTDIIRCEACVRILYV